MGVALLVVVGCANPVQPTPPASQPAPETEAPPTNQQRVGVYLPASVTSPGDGDLTFLARLGGFVRGDQATGCVWIELLDGSEVSVLWPRGYFATFDPLVIYDPVREPIARDGDELEFVGGSFPFRPGWDPTNLPPECRHGDAVWITGQVVPY
jgi:hypothetical protein